MKQINGKNIPIPRPTTWQAQQNKKHTHAKGRMVLWVIEMLVTIAIGICALLSTTVFLAMCW